MHQAGTGLDMLKTVRVSQAQAWQRTGRAGRECEGHCYRMLTKEEFHQLPKATMPEVLRCNLSSIVLQLLSIGVEEVQNFDFLESPPKHAIEASLRSLELLGAVKVEAGTRATLTELGKRMSAFPLDPQFTKIILLAEEYGCT